MFCEYVSLLVLVQLSRQSSVHLDGSSCPVAKRNVSEAFGENRIFPALNVVWSIASAGWCSMRDAAAHMHLSQTTYPKVLDLSCNLPAVFHAYDPDLDA